MTIASFINKNIKHSLSGLLYMCGHPGTGKTSLLNQILSDVHDESVLIVKLNANSFTSFELLLRHIIKSV